MPVAKTKSTKSSGKRRAAKARDFALDQKERKIHHGLAWMSVGVGNPTYHEGANDERTAILAKVRRLRKDWEQTTIEASPFADLETWLLSRNERYKKNPGGL